MNLLIDSIKHFSSLHPNKPAIISGGNIINYSELEERITSTAAHLVSNIKPGERIGVLLPNSIEAILAMYAIPLAGGIAVPIDITLHPRNISYILEDTKSRFIVTSSPFSDVLEDVNYTIFKLNIDSFPELYRANIFPNQDPEKTAFIFYTTGTTGTKKGVELSHCNLLASAQNIIEFMALTPDIVESVPMPLTHSFGFARVRCVFGVGGTVIIENGLLRADHVIASMKQYGANAISSVPAGFAIFLGYYESFFKEIAAQIRFIEIGSAFMPIEHKDRLIRLCPNARICMHFGLTEASRAAFINFRQDYNHINTIGKPSPNVAIEIRDDNGQSVPIGEKGLIWIKGDMVMKRYWKKPELTFKTLIDGWLNSGDIGALDENGFLHLFGRKKELINVAGLKIAPAEIESVLDQHPNIHETAVIGLPNVNDISNEVIKAYVVLADGIAELDIQKLQKFCLQNLESYKVPQQFDIIESIPKTNSGKVQRQLLEQIE
tara:strand:- start:5170 stop:6645 length:1476 start_codon:yes stop_codon:yes gene_type:complete